MALLDLNRLGELVLTTGLRRSMSSASSWCWMGLANDTRLDCGQVKELVKNVSLTPCI
jgi:hypothetical protein